MIKRLFALLTCSLPLFAAPVDWGDQESFARPPPFLPFSMGGSYAQLAPASFYTPSVQGQTITYKQSDANFSYTHPFSDQCGLIFGAGWVGVDVNWAQNPDFDQTFFGYYSGSFGGFTRAFSNWLWTLNLSIFLDSDHFSFADYALYQSILWGKYTCLPQLELNFGFLLEVGLDKDKVWPILGFIYTFNEKCRLNAVYPVDMSLQYDLLPCLTLGGSLKIFRNRHRVGPDEPFPSCIFVYQTWGAEADARFRPAPWFFVNGFIGYTTGGNFTILNSGGKHGTHYKFQGSAYGGGYAALSF
jgi:hypothetical protein